MTALPEYFAARRAAVLALTRQLVERETPSRVEAPLHEIAAFVAQLFSELGAQIELTRVAGYGTHLRARLFQERPHDTPHADGQQLLVVGHLDTVWPLGTLARLPFRVTAAGAAHGPGVFDMKANVAALLEALRAIKQLDLSVNRPLTVLLTCDEEIGSRTSRALIEAEGRHAAAALVLEPPLAGGVVKTGRKGIGVYQIKAKGRAAHAGLDPTNGINAIVELAHHTLALAALNDYERGVTLNVGQFNGGTTSNVVPAEAVAQIDLRFWQMADGERLCQTIEALQPQLAGAALEIKGGINRPPMERSPKNIALFEHARQLAAELGHELKDAVVGGGSDGNFTAALGVATLDGLGIDGAGAHAEHEHILIEDIPRRTALLTRLIQTI